MSPTINEINAEASRLYVALRKRAKQRESAHTTVPEIEHDVPLPVERRGGARNHTHFYPFERMQVGDSFWIAAQTTCTAGACHQFTKRTGWRFMTRAQGRDGVPNNRLPKRLHGTRVWRVA